MDYAVVGKPVPALDAVDKVTGAARYAADVNLPGMLWATFLTARTRTRASSGSTPAGRRRSRAWWRSSPRRAWARARRRRREDTVHGFKLSQSLFAEDVVRYQGEKIAAVAAISAGDRRRTRSSVIEVEYELLPAVDDVEAVKPDAPLIRADAKTVDAVAGSPGRTGAVPEHRAGDALRGGRRGGGLRGRRTTSSRTSTSSRASTRPTSSRTPASRRSSRAARSRSGPARSRSSPSAPAIASSLGIPQSKINVVGHDDRRRLRRASSGTLVHPYAVLLCAADRPAGEDRLHPRGGDAGRPPRARRGDLGEDGRQEGRHDHRAPGVGLWDCGNVPGASHPRHRAGSSASTSSRTSRYDAYGVYTNKPGTAAYRAPGAPAGQLRLRGATSTAARPSSASIRSSSA